MREVKLDFNVGVFITGIENLYEKSDVSVLESFVFLLRTCSLYFPNFLKIVLTCEKRASKTSTIDKILEILATKSIYEIKDSEVFDQEGKSYLDFALGYGAKV